MTVLALDIGGTKIAAAHVAPDGTLLARAEHPTGPAPTTTLRRLVASFAVPGLTAVGVGSAGPLDAAAGTVSPVNIRAWRGFPLADAVRRSVGAVPVVLAGDAQCMAVGEWWLGGRDVTSLLGIVVSTGIGGGAVLRGVPILGTTGNAGHIGHIVVDPDGEPCPCGARGCLETVASGPSMVRWALARGWTPGGADPADTAKALTAAARDGVPAARAAFDRAADALATAIRTTTAILDISDVVIGGGVAAAGALLLDPLRAALARHATLTFQHDLTVTTTSLARDAGLYGAAALALIAEGAALRPGSVPRADRRTASA
jgi:predicted NBD/HSP70 family sugar kinase